VPPHHAALLGDGDAALLVAEPAAHACEPGEPRIAVRELRDDLGGRLQRVDRGQVAAVAGQLGRLVEPPFGRVLTPGHQVVPHARGRDRAVEHPKPPMPDGAPAHVDREFRTCDVVQVTPSGGFGVRAPAVSSETVPERAQHLTGLARFVPVLSWLPRYERAWLRGDVAAGIAVTALVVPKNLGYAGIAGVPLQNGLYAAAAGALIYAVFCTSRHISTGPSSSLAAVAGGAVLVTGLDGGQAAQLVAAITLATGALFLLLAVFKMGWIARFLSKAVITGFLAGAAVDVVIGELPKLTGTTSEGSSAWRELATWIGSLGDVHWTTVLVGVAALALILGLRFVAPAVPGALVLVAAGLAVSYTLDLGAHGVALVGDVPRGLPSPALPDLTLVENHAAVIGVAAFALLLIGFSQTAGDARAFAARHHYRIDVNQESIAQGMANVGAGVFQGMPVSTSLSASSLNESAGARTPVASLVTGALVLATLLVLAPLFSHLPKAVLAAVIIDAVVFGMIDVGELRRLHRVTPFDFWVAVAAIVGVLSVGVLAGVMIGVVLSLGWLVYVATRPPMPVLGREQGTQVFRELAANPDDETYPGIVVLRLDGGLFFATAEALEDRVRELADQGGATAFVLDLEGVDFVDSQGTSKIAELHELAESEGFAMRLARVKPHVLRVLETDGIVEQIGRDHIHGNVDRAVAAQLADAQAPGRWSGASS
jgi:SulP family sulfate permease